MRFSSYTTSAILLATVSALPSGKVLRSYTVFESIKQVPSGYVATNEPVSSTANIKLSIHLEQQNVAAFESKLYEISDPDHETYGNHMSQAEIDKMMQPRSDSATAVKQWLASFGLTPESVTSDSITVTVPVAKAETMLNSEYKQYRDTQSNVDRRVLRTTEYSLPASLHEHVAFVQPTTMFPLRSQGIFTDEAAAFRYPPAGYKPIVTSLDPSCKHVITPSCLSYLYNFAGYTPVDNSVLGIQGFLDQGAQYKDLQTFLALFAPQWSGRSFDVISVNGGTNLQNETVANVANVEEANLDTQYAVSISSPIKNVFITTAGSPPWIPEPDDSPADSNEPYLEWLTYLLAQETLPQTLTTSYGDPEQTVPKAYAHKVCNMLAQLGARGTSVLFSAGDYGIGNDCLSNDGKNTTRMNPNFPATCPFVTAIGGTQSIEPEEAWNRNGGPSGAGGFSGEGYFTRPHYQDTQVSHYFRKHSSEWKPFEQYFNKPGRGFPDISAQADNYTIIIEGLPDPILIGGTSAAAPVVASIVALLNSDRIANGKAPLGFLNPWLYSRKVAKYKGIKDITVGKTTGCGDDGYIPNGGWTAVSGWDPATGLGTPNFYNLKAAMYGDFANVTKI